MSKTLDDKSVGCGLRGALPYGWTWATVSQLSKPDEQAVLTGPFGSVLGRGDFIASGIPLLTIGCLTLQGIRLEKPFFISKEKAEKLSRYRVRKGDLLFSRSAAVGRAGIVTEEFDGSVINYHLMRLRLDAEVIRPRIFLSYVRGSRVVRDYLRTVNHGATRDGINTSDLLAMPVAIPPICEQDRIADKLDELLSDLDAGVAALEGVRAKLKQYRAAVLKAAVEGSLTADWRAQHPDAEPASALVSRILAERRCRWEEAQLEKFKEAGKAPPKNWKDKYKEAAAPETKDLPPLPQGWCWASPAQLGNVQLGRQRAPQHHSGEFMRPYLRVANVYEGRIDLGSVYEMNFTPEEFKTYHLADGDILLNEGQSLELVGRSAIYRGELSGACFTNTLVRFRPSNAIMADYAQTYFCACLRSHRFRKIARWTTNIAHLGADRFAEMEVPVPPLKEQSVIVEAVEAQLSVIDHLEADLEAKLKSAQALRQSILRDAFAGKLVPQDPNDEPASELLKRIAAERAQIPKVVPKTSRKRLPLQ